MGFRAGAFARIWKVENKGNYSICNLSISRKKKDSEEFETEFQDGFVRLVGNAHEFAKGLQIGKGGVPVKITSCDVTNKYYANKGETYVNFAVFGLEDASFGGSSSNSSSASPVKAKRNPKVAAQSVNDIDEDEAQLPF